MEKYVFDKNTKQILESSCVPFAIFQFMEDRVVTHLITDGLCEIVGLSREQAYELMSNHIYDNDHPDDVARLGNAALEFASGKKDFNIVYRTKTPDGYHILHARGKHVNAPSGERLAVVWYSDEGPYSDENKHMFEQAMEHLLIQNESINGQGYDSMTGLPNMNYFFKLAEKTRNDIFARGEEPVLLYFDLNDMKSYNLRNGFAEGDKLIVGLSRILVSHFSNIYCSRLSGDHFVVITREEGIEHTLNEIFEEVKSLNDGKSLFVRTGIYKKTGEAVPIGVACDRAKLACDSKRDIAESTFTYFTEDLLKASQLRHYIIENIDNALENGWIQVYYQPIVRSVSGQVCDEEALARWIDPNMGFMSPADFIPVLEETKLLYKLDLYVLDCILERMKLFKEKGFHIVPCSINISRNDFDACDVVEEIRKRVDEAGVGRDKITVEITESAVGEDIDYLSKQVDLLNELGFYVWMDDYGTGYSSPDNLQQIGFSTIKLDMTFMRSFDKTKKSRIIISELINMAINLNMDVVVEGVETKEQVQFLREVGATKMQGYYFTKPLSVDQILERYDKGTQIGFENPLESDYFEAIGRVNLYNFAAASGSSGQTDYFNALPMAIYEVRESELDTIRCNRSYEKSLQKIFRSDVPPTRIPFTQFSGQYRRNVLDLMLRCADGEEQIIEERTFDKIYKANMLFRRVAVNPVTGTKAVALVLLDVREVNNSIEAVSFGSIAQALSADYLNLYYVDLDTEDYTEFIPDQNSLDMSVEHKGSEFFKNSKKNSLKMIHKDDRERFVALFTKKNVLRTIEDEGCFSTIYRLMLNGEPLYVNLKAVLMSDKKHLLIGINDVDEQVRQQQEIHRAEEDAVIFSRMMALSGSFIAFYTVELDSDDYYLYNASEDFFALGTATLGSDFFGVAIEDVVNIVDPADYEYFCDNFRKEVILKTIDKKGLYSIGYHLIMDGKKQEVCLKAAKVVEDGDEKLIIGIEKIGDSI